MVGTGLRVPRGFTLFALCCAVVTAAALGGCARVVTGAARVGDPSRPLPPVPVADLLIEPTRFPTQYSAAVLPQRDIARVLADIDGVPTGSAVTPPECAPLPVLAEQKAAVQGTDDRTGARLTVVVVRPVASVRARVTQLGDCPSFSTTTTDDGETARVTIALPPPPPVDADDSYAVDQTVASASSDDSDSRTLTLVALVDDVQVMASWQQRPGTDDEPDAQALDTLFTDAVLKVRRKIPR